MYIKPNSCAKIPIVFQNSISPCYIFCLLCCLSGKMGKIKLYDIPIPNKWIKMQKIGYGAEHLYYLIMRLHFKS